MATSEDYALFVCEQLRDAGIVRHRKMFGEYMVYVDDRPLFLVCDNTVYVKQHDVVATLLRDAPKGFPYPGAKEHHVLDIDNAALACEVAERLLPVTPLPKPKKKRVAK